MIRENQKAFNIIQLFTDAIFCFLSLCCAFGLRFLDYNGSHLDITYYMKLSIFVIPAYLLIYKYFLLYESYRSKSILVEIRRILKSNILGIIIILVVLYILKQVEFSRLVLFFFAIINTLTSSVSRIIMRKILRRLRSKGYNLKTLLIVGWNENSNLFYDKIVNNKNLGYKFLGYINNDCLDNNKISYLGDFDALSDILDENLIDEAIISLDYQDYTELEHIINQCEKSGVKTSILPFYTKYFPAKPYVEEFEGFPFINIRKIPLDNFVNSTLKRCFDLFGSFILLILFSPLFLFVSIGIKLTSKGPVIYKQERIGLNKKVFTMYKFRSMKVSADEKDKTAWSTKVDDRRTKFGSFIRKCSIDELPQLFNVFIGDMSLVGPRPEIPFFVHKFQQEIPRYMVKHQVRPGITGWAQVNGWRGDTSIEERINCDIYYIENWTFLDDIKILFMTLFKGVINKSETI